MNVSSHIVVPLIIDIAIGNHSIFLTEMGYFYRDNAGDWMANNLYYQLHVYSK